MTTVETMKKLGIRATKLNGGGWIAEVGNGNAYRMGMGDTRAKAVEELLRKLEQETNHD